MSMVAAAERNLVTTSMAEFSAQHPDLRYTFFGGKGGVGKTVMAGVAAVHLASTGKRVLLASTNPMHSLSGLLDQDVFGRHTPVKGVENLWALEIDTRESIERAKREIKEKIEWFLKFAEIKTKADEFVGAAAANPAFEESAMFENMTDLMFGNEYDTYVFDTAPTANARRLLGMSKVYALWVNKMMKSREEAQSLRELLSFTKKKQADPLMTYLTEFQRRISHARDLLTDEQRTAFFFVTLPEALPIAVIRRFVNWFTDFGIPVGGVIVNQVIEPGDLDSVPEFVRNRVAMQREHLEAIGEEFPGMVRAVLPLHDDEIRGPSMLLSTATELFGPS
jgi:arsenite/tail-anchored protein-transporting ATPase